MIVIADTGPLRYLVLIDAVQLLPILFGDIFIPPGVALELTQPRTPQPVRDWIDPPPPWLFVLSPTLPLPPLPSGLGLGEQEAIALAQELQADALLVDDEAARREAMRRQIPVQGTLGVLDLAAEHGLVDMRMAIRRLEQTNFRASRKLIDIFIERDIARRR